MSERKWILAAILVVGVGAVVAADLNQRAADRPTAQPAAFDAAPGACLGAAGCCPFAKEAAVAASRDSAGPCCAGGCDSCGGGCCGDSAASNVAEETEAEDVSLVSQ